MAGRHGDSHSSDSGDDNSQHNNSKPPTRDLTSHYKRPRDLTSVNKGDQSRELTSGNDHSRENRSDIVRNINAHTSHPNERYDQIPMIAQEHGDALSVTPQDERPSTSTARKFGDQNAASSSFKDDYMVDIPLGPGSNVESSSQARERELKEIVNTMLRNVGREMAPQEMKIRNARRANHLLDFRQDLEEADSKRALEHPSEDIESRYYKQVMAMYHRFQNEPLGSAENDAEIVRSMRKANDLPDEEKNPD